MHRKFSIIFAAELANEVSDGNLEKDLSHRISRVAEIEDLQGPRDLAVAPLCIKV